ncbi:MAG: hypothetical protein WA294_10170, partial [Acidobacteriaceae bacterium]
MPDFGHYDRVVYGVAVCAGLVLLVYALYLLLVIVHEAGHLTAGLICRFTPQSVRVGPVEWKRAEDNKWTWKFDFRWGLLTSGHTRMATRPFRLSGICGRYLFRVLAGPFANLLAALATVPFAFDETAFGAFCKFFILGSVLV